jgi:hypothetical protein
MLCFCFSLIVLLVSGGDLGDVLVFPTSVSETEMGDESFADVFTI